MSEEGDVDMCKAMDDLIKSGEERGEQRGEQRGIILGEESGKIKMIKLIQCMVADGALNLIPQITEKSDFCEKMFAKYDIE